MNAAIPRIVVSGGGGDQEVVLGPPQVESNQYWPLDNFKAAGDTELPSLIQLKIRTSSQVDGEGKPTRFQFAMRLSPDGNYQGSIEVGKFTDINDGGEKTYALYLPAGWWWMAEQVQPSTLSPNTRLKVEQTLELAPAS